MKTPTSSHIAIGFEERCALFMLRKGKYTIIHTPYKEVYKNLLMNLKF
jgi:NAD(P)H-hydrate repair Nnr-like enzyme with NAD(P)H-hydrate dehydratase domain